MPGFDGTGPLGQGATTGRGLGPCGGGLRRGLARGFGRGLGLRQRPWTKKEQLTAWQDEEKSLEEELKSVKEEIKSLKGQK